MSTENPKISAYVPQIIYDRFKQFQKDRSLSMSQAVIQLFAEYFDIDLNASVPQQSTSSLLSRLNILETDLAGLKEAYVLLAQRVDFIQSTSRLPIDTPVCDSNINGVLPSEPLNELSITENIISDSNNSLPGELLVDNTVVVSDGSELDGGIFSELPKNDVVEELSSESELNSSLPDKLAESCGLNDHLLSSPLQLSLTENNEIIDSELPSKPTISPLSTEILACRFGLKKSTFDNKKSKLVRKSPEEFFNWLQQKDPNNIRWRILTEKRSTKYIPAEDTSLANLEHLRDWLQAQNQG
jgi:hypothetical protein